MSAAGAVFLRCFPFPLPLLSWLAPCPLPLFRCLLFIWTSVHVLHPGEIPCRGEGSSSPWNLAYPAAKGFPGGSKESARQTGDARDTDSIPGSGRFPGEGNGNPFHYSCRGSPIGQRSLGGYSPRGHKKSDTAGRACMHAAQSCLNHFQSLHEGVTSADSAWAVTHRAWLWHHLASLAGRLLSDKELGFGIRQIRARNLTIVYAPWHWANPLRIWLPKDWLPNLCKWRPSSISLREVRDQSGPSKK